MAQIRYGEHWKHLVDIIGVLLPGIKLIYEAFIIGDIYVGIIIPVKNLSTATANTL